MSRPPLRLRSSLLRTPVDGAGLGALDVCEQHGGVSFEDLPNKVLTDVPET